VEIVDGFDCPNIVRGKYRAIANQSPVFPNLNGIKDRFNVMIGNLAILDLWDGITRA
jgi:hypothetical protein